MKKLSMIVAAAFAFVSLGALAAPKAAETAGSPVSMSEGAPAPMAHAGGKHHHAKKKAGKKHHRAHKAM